MKKCGLINLQKYMENDLSEKETIEFKVHLDICATCRENLEILKRQDTLLAELDMDVAPQSFTSKVMANLPELKPRKKLSPFTQVIICLALISLIALVYNIIPYTDINIILGYFSKFTQFCFAMFKSIMHYAVNSPVAKCAKMLFAHFRIDIMHFASKVVFYETILLLIALAVWEYKKIKSGLAVHIRNVK